MDNRNEAFRVPCTRAANATRLRLDRPAARRGSDSRAPSGAPATRGPDC